MQSYRFAVLGRADGVMKSSGYAGSADFTCPLALSIFPTTFLHIGERIAWVLLVVEIQHGAPDVVRIRGRERDNIGTLLLPWVLGV